jgi:hypothetical protein
MRKTQLLAAAGPRAAAPGKPDFGLLGEMQRSARLKK